MCYGTTQIPSSLSWRLPFIILAAYSLTFTAMAVAVLPDSPRWLTLRGRGNEAAAAWEKLGIDPVDREKIAPSLQLSDSSEVDTRNAVTEKTETHPAHAAATPGTTVLAKQPQNETPRQTTILEAFSSPETRPQLLFALFIMGMQQMSGIDGVLFVSPTGAVAYLQRTVG
jgi:hypothetical protein